MMRKFPRLQWLVLVSCLVAITPSAVAQAPPARDFELPADSSVPFLVLRQTPSELVGQHAVELRVFADGRCELVRPAIMRGAGRHQWQLAASEVRSLARQAVDAGIAELDVAALRASLVAAAAERNDSVVAHRLDDDVLELEIRLDRLRGRGAVVRQLRFVGLRADRARHPDDDRVRRISELRDRLDALARAGAPLPGDAQ